MSDISEKEIIFKFDMLITESFYIKLLLGEKWKFKYMLIRIFCLIIVIESMILMHMDYSSWKYSWLVIPAIYIFDEIKEIIIDPKKRIKKYKKILDENEDFYSYIFYTDCVKIKTQTVEATFKYDSAEGYIENEEKLLVFFSLNRSFTIDKNQCNEEQINFIKNIIPKDKQKKFEKKTNKKFNARLSSVVVLAIFFGSLIGRYDYINQNTYYLEYPSTTYESFLDCLEYGTVDDILIVKDEYIEYTFTGRDKYKRYYTVCSDDIQLLIKKLNHENINWESKNAKYCKNA